MLLVAHVVVGLQGQSAITNARILILIPSGLNLHKKPNFNFSLHPIPPEIFGNLFYSTLACLPLLPRDPGMRITCGRSAEVENQLKQSFSNKELYYNI